MSKQIISTYYNKGYKALVPRGTSMKAAKSAIHSHIMRARNADGVPVWFEGEHVGPYTIYRFDIWF